MDVKIKFKRICSLCKQERRRKFKGSSFRVWWCDHCDQVCHLGRECPVCHPINEGLSGTID